MSNGNSSTTVGLVPADRIRMMTDSARLEAIADLARALAKRDDRVGRLARNIERQARDAANGLRELVLLDMVGNG